MYHHTLTRVWANESRVPCDREKKRKFDLHEQRVKSRFSYETRVFFRFPSFARGDRSTRVLILRRKVFFFSYERRVGVISSDGHAVYSRIVRTRWLYDPITAPTAPSRRRLREICFFAGVSKPHIAC